MPPSKKANSLIPGGSQAGGKFKAAIRIVVGEDGRSRRQRHTDAYGYKSTLTQFDVFRYEIGKGSMTVFINGNLESRR
jgi:hypothetical protein